jgi:3-oxoacyl-[acyl-carrier protein] reductase
LSAARPRPTTSPDRPLEGRVALVTGAGSAVGIGFACARVLAEDGASVALVSTTARIHDRAAELATATRAETLGLVADLADPGRATGVVEATVARFGRLDVLVNNAGMTSQVRPAVERALAGYSDEEWAEGLTANLTIAFNVTRAALPGMKERGWGRIVNMSSVTGPVVVIGGTSCTQPARPGCSA